MCNVFAMSSNLKVHQQQQQKEIKLLMSESSLHCSILSEGKEKSAFKPYSE